MVGKTEGSTRRGGALALFTALALLLAGATAAIASANAGGGLSPVAATPPAPVPTPAPGTASATVFPVRGAHQLWDGIGAGRGHQGVDIGARCGTPLVAAQAGRITYSKWHSRAGNYLVLDAAGSTIDLMYAHMREVALVRAGQPVAAGQLLGYVGDTGNASGCHLHLEVWEGTYYRGGAPVDPMPYLASWKRSTKRAYLRGTTR